MLGGSQMTLMPESTPAVEFAGDIDYGEVFTRRWVVELILDLCGYAPDRDLTALSVIEPACGSGAFLVPLVERLAESARLRRLDLSGVGNAIHALDIREANVLRSRARVSQVLVESGLNDNAARALAAKWVRQGDFLLEPPAERSADLVIGNPPYIRLESVHPATSQAYRLSCPTMGGRADIYIGFYERGLRALGDNGILGFICADRWMRNAYGARLRELVTNAWSVDAIISMTEVDAFEDTVNAYPAITVLRRAPQKEGPLMVNATPEFNGRDARKVVELSHRRRAANSAKRFQAARLPSWFKGRQGWPNGSPAQIAAIAELESCLPSLEDHATGTKVGIGLATGADRIFITQDSSLVERERTLPLAMVRDIANGTFDWSGHYLINPWDEKGLVELVEWPALERYLTSHKSDLAKRHTARSGKWHKTIDRVIGGLKAAEKLYLPDFKDALFPVLDHGDSYPHHNLYWITSEKWDLEVLGGILLSDVANLFINAYSVRMRGGYLRFQAQYLRRIRVPRAEAVDPASAAALRKAFRRRNREEATSIALGLYGLDNLPA